MKQYNAEIKLGSIISTLKGNAFKSECYTDSGVPIVRVSDFTENSISVSDIVYAPIDVSENNNRYKLVCGDILIQTVGSWQHNPLSIVGKVVRVPKVLDGALLNQNIVKVIPNKGVDKDYLYYRLKDESFKLHTLGCAQGAANQASITLTTINSFKLQLPNFTKQKKVASILSAYDDLIENNLQRIKLLEEMTQITYEEWFVRMKFPGHEKAVIDSENGLPEGWGKQNLSKYISIKHGYAYKGEHFTELQTNRILLTPGNFRVGGGLKLDKVKYYNEDAESPKDYVLKQHDLLVTMTDLSKMADTLGYPLLVPSDERKSFLHNQRLGKIQSENLDSFPKYFYYMLSLKTMRIVDLLLVLHPVQQSSIHPRQKFWHLGT